MNRQLFWKKMPLHVFVQYYRHIVLPKNLGGGKCNVPLNADQQQISESNVDTARRSYGRYCACRL